MRYDLAIFFKVSFMVLLLPMLNSCFVEEDNLNRYIEDVMARPSLPIPPIPAVRTYTPYVYDGLSGRDPFRSSTSEGTDEVWAETKNDGPRPDLTRTREYLERFELDTLSMVGTFAKETNDWVLIRDPDGVIHRVAVGNYIGKNHGKVGAITPADVTISEFVSDGAGGWLVREASMALGNS